MVESATSILKVLARKKFKKLDFKDFKMSMGHSIPESLQRCQLIRSVIDKTLLVDANQFWDRDKAIFSVKNFKQTRFYSIEESTSFDNIVGYIDTD